MSDAQGFWSYVRDDDHAEHGRIYSLAHDLVDQYELISGEAVKLFIDRDQNTWGTEWQSAIDESLAATVFFIPVLTPRYFQSAACRHELTLFSQKAEQLGLRELIMPILYVDIDQIHEDAPEDDAVALVKKYQWEDWRDIRYEDPSSSAYRKAVAGMAAKLLSANRHVDDTAVALPTDEGTADPEEPGSLDLIAEAERLLPSIGTDFEQLTTAISHVNDITTRRAKELDDPRVQAKGFAGRILLFRGMAADLSEDVEQIYATASNISESLNQVDAGMRELIPMLAAEDPTAQEVQEFADVIVQMREGTDDSREQVEALIQSIRPVEKLSRDLRPTLRRLREGLTLVTESGKVSASWVEQLTEVGILTAS